MISNEKNVLVLLSLTSVISVVQSEFKLVLLHTNDMHARFEETNAHSGPCLSGKKCYGGFARLKTAVERFRNEAREDGWNSVFLNAGDTYQGTAFYTYFKDKIVTELLNMMGIDVMSLGNHEFDDGPEGLAPFIANSKTPIVCANIDYSKVPVLSNLTQLVPSYVITVDGVKIGVVGYLTPETVELARVGSVTLRNEIEAIKEEVARLKGEGVKILIALGHSGYVADKMIARDVPDLDVVVGGHTNTFLYNGHAPGLELPEGPYPTVVEQSSGRKVLVVQAYAYTKYLGRLKLIFDDYGEILQSEGNPVLIDESFRKDGEMERAVLKYSNNLTSEAGHQIGTSKVFLEGDKICRIRECTMGNLATDAIIYVNAKDFTGKGWTDAPVAFLQGGSFRISIDTESSAGAITRKDLLTVMPFMNTVEKLTVKGSVLKAVLEHSVERYSLEERFGGFLQFSGIRVEYDLSRPPQHRVVSAKIRCGDCIVPEYLPLDESKEYHVLTSSFVADGGDGYAMLKGATSRKSLASSDVDSVTMYLEKLSLVYPEIGGRIRLINSPSESRSDAAKNMPVCSLLILISTVILYATGS